jgi:DNA polymerase elongation subunit (family B)
MVTDTFKITQVGNHQVLIIVDQNTINSIKNFDSKMRKVLRNYATLSPMMRSIQKIARIERYMVDESFDSDVCYTIRTEGNLQNLQQDLEAIK